MELTRRSEESEELQSVKESEDCRIEVNYRWCGREDHGVDLVTQFGGEIEEGKGWLLRRRGILIITFVFGVGGIRRWHR
jgi:hypothetical protein